MGGGGLTLTLYFFGEGGGGGDICLVLEHFINDGLNGVVMVHYIYSFIYLVVGDFLMRLIGSLLA